jgi:hypothetical protein
MLGVVGGAGRVASSSRSRWFSRYCSTFVRVRTITTVKVAQTKMEGFMGGCSVLIFNADPLYRELP